MAYTQYQMTLIETWKPISNAPNYEVSTFGRLKKDGCIRPASKGIYYTTVSINNKSQQLHILVMETFVGVRPKEAKLIVNHKDRNVKNNRLDNLEYLTSKGNALHVVLEKIANLEFSFSKKYITELSKQYENEKKKALKLTKIGRSINPL